jgi:hypothetical protein
LSRTSIAKAGIRTLISASRESVVHGLVVVVLKVAAHTIQKDETECTNVAMKGAQMMNVAR